MDFIKATLEAVVGAVCGVILKGISVRERAFFKRTPTSASDAGIGSVVTQSPAIQVDQPACLIMPAKPSPVTCKPPTEQNGYVFHVRVEGSGNTVTFALPGINDEGVKRRKSR